MNFYIEDKATGTRFIFPIIPNKVNITSGANTIPINIIGKGEMRIPRGEKATGYSWDGTLPGRSMKDQSFVTTWTSPKLAVNQLEKWKRKGTKLHFLVENLIDADVFIENFNRDFYGMGHCHYNIMLTIYPVLTVTTSPAPAPKKKKGKGGQYPTGVITGSKVKYRKGPGKNYKKLGTLKKGETVTIYGTSGNWYKIKENQEGWVCASYVKITSGQEQQPTKTKSSGGGKKPQKRTPTATQPTKQPLTPKVPTSKYVRVGATTVMVQKPGQTGKITQMTQ